ncbi:N-acetylmuramoyl-L-alanine amidase [Streptomyces sp. DH37]|uniref:peptidoglycan recognition protein family protein n=1 Tax=Streptomyces sp. DH37 TaxID=3040122 RepID=UPI0024424A70|nr:N-acetylmuramoyl-L-alanine amidase [Streptomyces sp. DH37]MDG9705536.1 N-acetylmuramoyl-L-alanine amidase [Streptomyces sp. DH37]
MAWYPGATKMELQPESDAQAAIRPTQLIIHSIVAPWTARRTYEYWRDSTTLESHFGLGYQGDLAQYIGTETRADANAGANRRPDGTGAVSVETASNTSASDPWTVAQVEQLIRLGVWMHTHHGVPLRICRSHDDPGFGYHCLHRAWSTSGTACPGPARIKQFREVVFPGIVARATGKTTTPKEESMALSTDDVKKVWNTDGFLRVPWGTDTNPHWAPSSVLTYAVEIGRENRGRIKEVQAQLGALTEVVVQLASGGGLDAAEIRAAAEAGAQAALDRLGAALTDDTTP